MAGIFLIRFNTDEYRSEDPENEPLGWALLWQGSHNRCKDDVDSLTQRSGYSGLKSVFR